MLTARRLLTATALLLPLSHAALASSDDAWKAMEKDVRAKCREAALEHLKPVRVVVDPTGTDKYALAIAFGKLKSGDDRASFICLYDKTTKKATLGGELREDVIRVRMPKKEGADDAAAKPKAKAGTATTAAPAATAPTAKPVEGTDADPVE